MAATTQARVTVANTATALDQSATASDLSVLIRNRGAVTVYVGGSGVTAATGYQLDPGEAVSIDTGAFPGLYGITAAGTAVCHVLQVGR